MQVGGGQMKNYESIKQMNLEEMAITMYLLIAPFAEAVNGGKLEEPMTLEIIGQIKGFLQAEVKQPNK